MRTTIISCFAATTLVLAACGGGDSVGGDQGRVIDLVIETAGDVGIEVDESCVSNLYADLSDDDAKAIADAGVEGNPDVSDEGSEIGDRVFSECVDAESYLDTQIGFLTESDSAVDAECLKTELTGLTVDEIDAQIFDAAFACTTDS